LKDILARSHRRVLADFARSNVLLAFDYDGTLAPIVSDPERAVMRRRTRRLLGRLARVYPCVVISGRSRREVKRMLDGVALTQVVGNHGIEPHRPSREFRALVRRWRALLNRSLEGLGGVAVEDKGLSLTIHFRRSRRKIHSREAVFCATAGLPRARVFGGKDVVNVVPQRAPHKGIALETERGRLGCTKAIYVGDDETDEDVFSRRRRHRLLSIRVGAEGSSNASYCLRSQADIDALLRELLALRERPTAAASLVRGRRTRGTASRRRAHPFTVSPRSRGRGRVGATGRRRARKTSGRRGPAA
jgi:trehalose 6-phosphate phosphatase